MKRKITIEKLEEGKGATLYVFTIGNEAKSEYVKFWEKYESNKNLQWEFDVIDQWIEKFLNDGCEEEEFRRVTKTTKSLPINVGSKLRLYCYRLDKGILILGNGGEKPSNPDPKKNRIKDFPDLHYYCETIKAIGTEIEAQLKEPIKSNKIGKINNNLVRLNPIEINIQNEPKP